MRVFLCLCSLACGVTAIAAPLSVIPVGSFGGYRVKAACNFGSSGKLCTLDTMGSVSVLPGDPEYLRYSVVGHEKVSGIGQELDCDVVDVPDLVSLDIRPAHLYPLRCNSSNTGFPLLGLPFFDHRTFLFDFPNQTFSWDVPAANPKPLIRIGGEKLWIAVPAELHGEKIMVAFDTGNPVTIVNRAFVDSHPAIFRPSLKPISPGLLEKGLVPYDVLAPFVVDGVELNADAVYAGSKFPALFFEQAAVILGMNHAAQARWWFDLERDLYRVTR
ncbi:MAG: hypothetical protein ACXWP1_06560 [Bdellovibrionota bacterium]